MTDVSPAQRTASTARIVLTAGVVFALEAIWRDSVVRTMLAVCLIALGGGLLAAAKRAD
jgi:hypothetical protein